MAKSQLKKAVSKKAQAQKKVKGKAGSLDIGGERNHSNLPEDSLDQRIGSLLRHYRQANNLTLSEMAKASGISTAMLSRIETGRASASIETLTRYASTLGVPLSLLFRQLELPDGEAQLVKNDKGMEVVRIGTKEAGYSYKILGYNQGPEKLFEPFLVEMDENSRSYASFEHTGTEFIHMLKGKMEYRYGKNLYLLEPGDSLTFSAEIEHGPEKLLSKKIQFLAIIVYSQQDARK